MKIHIIIIFFSVILAKNFFNFSKSEKSTDSIQ